MGFLAARFRVQIMVFEKMVNKGISARDEGPKFSLDRCKLIWREHKLQRHGEA